MAKKKKPIVVAVSNIKGGVAKTTTAATLGAGLNNLKNKKVLLIDADPQTNLTICFMDEPDENSMNTLHKIFTKERTIDDVKVNIREGLDIVPGDFELCSADLDFLGLPGSFNVIEKAIRKSKDEYDFVVIDTPPNLGILTLSAFVACNYIITPMSAEAFSLKAIKLLKRTINFIEDDTERKIPVAGILLTKYNGRTVLSKNIEESINKCAELLKTKVFESRIRESTIVKNSQYLQKDLFEYAPKHNVTKDYEDFINEFLERIGEE